MIVLKAVTLINGVGNYAAETEEDLTIDDIWTAVQKICNDPEYANSYRYVFHYMDKIITRQLNEGKYSYNLNLTVVLESR